MRFSFKNLFFIFLFSFSIIIGSSYNTYLSFERFSNPDSETYLNIAKFNFKGQSLVRRYRIIVPALADAASFPIGKVYYKIVNEKRDKYDWPLLTGFFLINSILLACAAVMIYKIMKLQSITQAGCLIGLCIFLAGGRWASFTAGHPSVDSLTILCLATIVYGLLSSNRLLLSAGIIVGLLSKESIVLFFPFILIFSDKKIRLISIISMVIALALYFGVKYIVDHLSGDSSLQSINRVLATADSIKKSFLELFSIKGLANLFSVYGFFYLFFLTGLFYKSFRKDILPYCNKFFIIFLAIIVVHMLLSEELARMFYIGSALFVPFLAKCFDLNPLFEKFHSLEMSKE